jgi:hypothetical protein
MTPLIGAGLSLLVLLTGTVTLLLSRGDRFDERRRAQRRKRQLDRAGGRRLSDWSCMA